MMYTTVKIGCAAEQAFYHNIASVFSNVPKTYAKYPLETYLTSRIYHQNNVDLRNLYLVAIDTNTDEQNKVYLSSGEFDFSFFDTKNLSSTLPLHLNHNHLTLKKQPCGCFFTLFS